MRVHRLVALFSTTVLLGLLGVAAEASNNEPAPRAKKAVAVQTLRERVQNADVDGCGD